MSVTVTESVWQPKWESLGCPSIYQINVRVLLTELSSATGRTLTLNQLPDAYLAKLKDMGFDFLYLLGVWTTGEAGLKASQNFMKHHFPQVPSDQVVSSPFAICEYKVEECFGGDVELAQLRVRMSQHGLGLLLDFVPNHVAFDHEWASAEFRCNTRESLIMPGNRSLLEREPQNYFVVVEEKNGSNRLVMQGPDGLHFLRSNHDVETHKHVAVLAHGRDPHFDGWGDTAQLNYFSVTLRLKVIELLKHVSGMCDGVRCDMANLPANEILAKTWGSRFHEATGHGTPNHRQFWEEAISSVLVENPNFKFIAEVYWDMEGELMRQGFHFCYDKSLYDKLRQGDTHNTRQCLRQDANFQRRLSRFIENHDEDRAAEIYPNVKRHQGAALLAFCSLGMKFFHMGQFEGRVHRIPMQRKRNADPNGHDDSRWMLSNVEGVDKCSVPVQAANLYSRILPLVKTPAVKHGKFMMAEVHPSCHDSQTHHGIVSFFRVPQPPHNSVLVIVNYTNSWADGWVKFPHEVLSVRPRTFNRSVPESWFDDMGGLTNSSGLVLRDMLSTDCHRKSVDEANNKGVWFGLQPWQSHAYELVWR
eukprot:CAMPEP_0113845006 /NCGR_PEP_ID=MMETSP0372-20130328/529_1 /TAXON_ID=340204 /ORGANISM="Lankesteria abbotti" /LENGTH=587 /DNA_ID=CAMNT_0000814025 /DNA_START=27 /DNA_END=1790 /DNA_ORIENTATION=+ /assembly_acc=CAM_ASM_000359